MQRPSKLLQSPIHFCTVRRHGGRDPVRLLIGSPTRHGDEVIDSRPELPVSGMRQIGFPGGVIGEVLRHGEGEHPKDGRKDHSRAGVPVDKAVAHKYARGFGRTVLSFYYWLW